MTCFHRGGIIIMRNGLWTKGLVVGIIVSFIVSGIITISPVMKADLTDGLIGYWSVNDGTATDQSGNGNHGTVYGATVVGGKSGNAFSFDGDDDYIDIGDRSNFDITGDITISVWFKTSTSQMGCIVGKLDQVNPDNGYDLAMRDSFSTNPSGKILFRVASNSNGPSEYDAVQTVSTFTDNVWHLLTAIYTPDGVSRPKIYIDAVEQSVSNSGIPLSSIGASPGYPLKLAEYSPGSGVFNFNGALDDVRIYNRALTENEIQELFTPSKVYVDDDFTSSTTGWGYDHFSSIQAGVDAVDVGGTVYVSSGTYYESIHIDNSQHPEHILNNITFIGEDKQTTIINAIDNEINMGAIYIDTTHGFRISGFTLRGFNAPCVYSRDCDNTLITDCIFKDSTYGGLIYTEYTHENNTIRDCESYNNNVGIGVHGAAENYYLNRSSILNCYIHNNGIGVYVYGRSDWYGIINHTVVTGCDIFNNTEKGIFINQLLGKILGVTIYHNNFFNNVGNAYDNGTNVWFNITLHEGNYYDDYTGEDNNHDGIGDTPYNIPGGSNQDLYPLMNQYGSDNDLPIADAGGPYYANVGNSITFSGSGSSDTDGTITGYRWDFTNDGTYDTGWLASATTTHSYPAVGTYTVKLQVKDDLSGTDTDTAIASVTTEGGAIPTAEANGPYSGYVNYSIVFSSSGSIGGSEGTIVSWYWTFGDGAVSSQQNPTHKYTASGMYTVTLKVANNYGQIDNDTTTATITKLSPNQTPPVADAGGPYLGVVGSPVTFNGSGSSDADGTIVSYGWNFGDSTTGTGITPTHTYTTAGNYTVILTVTDNDTLTHSNSTTAKINVSGPPTIVIVVDVSNIEPIEEQNEKTITVIVYCYHQSVSNIHLEILQSSNLTITLLSPNITLNPGESRELLIKIKAPKLVIPKKSDAKVGDETIVLRAVGDGNVTSNTEQINIKVIKKGATPGFELVFVLCAVAIAIFLWRKKRSV
jgi:PKD repeat protein